VYRDLDSHPLPSSNFKLNPLNPLLSFTHPLHKRKNWNYPLHAGLAPYIGQSNTLQEKENIMKIASLIARYLLGLAFLVLGMNAYLHFLPMGPLPAGPAGQFLGVLVSTKYANVVALFQVVPAILFLFNRFVPLGLALLAPVLFNILIFHALMQPSGLPIALVLTVLWLLVFYPLRANFAGLLQKQA
jgi:hypothetical protein